MNEKYYVDNLVERFDNFLEVAKKLEEYGYKFKVSISTETDNEKASERIRLHRRLDGCILKNDF